MHGLKLTDTEGSISKEATDNHEHNVHAHEENCLDMLLEINQHS